ncbi:RnfABCDGE type electron transport complex subunit B, partial [endosymbiont of Ridgeia piscesae]
MLIAILAMTGLAAAFGLLLGYSSIRFHVEGDPITDQIEKLLPQTQCGQCGYAGCRPYAEAIASSEAEINLCPPGGETTMVALADLLGRDPVPLDAELNADKPRA